MAIYFKGASVIIICLLCSMFTAAQDEETILYKPTGFEKVKVTKDIVYRVTAGPTTLHFDIYGERQAIGPFAIIMNGFGDPAQKNQAAPSQWARAFAADGLPAITFESHPQDIGGDVNALLSFLDKNRSIYHWNGQCLLLAFSGHVGEAMPLLTDTSNKYFKGGILLYGLGIIKNFRQDLPVLFVRAGLDNPALNRRIDSMLTKVYEHNAPWTVINYSSGTHPFEFGPADPRSAQIIQQVLQFAHTVLSTTYQQASRDKEEFSLGAAALYLKEWPAAVQHFVRAAQQDPRNPELQMQLGHAFFGSGAYIDCINAYEHSLELGNWRVRDVSFPASLAAARLKDLTLTIKWLTRLSKTPGGKEIISSNSEFAYLKGNPDFEVLLK